jgi:hypothetical protein
MVQITVKNQSQNGVTIQVWTAGKGFKVAEHGIPANATYSFNLAHVWYDLEAIDGAETSWLKGVYASNITLSYPSSWNSSKNFLITGYSKEELLHLSNQLKIDIESLGKLVPIIQ